MCRVYINNDASKYNVEYIINYDELEKYLNKKENIFVDSMIDKIIKDIDELIESNEGLLEVENNLISILVDGKCPKCGSPTKIEYNGEYPFLCILDDNIEYYRMQRLYDGLCTNDNCDFYQCIDEEYFNKFKKAL